MLLQCVSKFESSSFSSLVNTLLSHPRQVSRTKSTSSTTFPCITKKLESRWYKPLIHLQSWSSFLAKPCVVATLHVFHTTNICTFFRVGKRQAYVVILVLDYLWSFLFIIVHPASNTRISTRKYLNRTPERKLSLWRGISRCRSKRAHTLRPGDISRAVTGQWLSSQRSTPAANTTRLQPFCRHQRLTREHAGRTLSDTLNRRMYACCPQEQRPSLPATRARSRLCMA